MLPHRFVRPNRRTAAAAAAASGACSTVPFCGPRCHRRVGGNRVNGATKREVNFEQVLRQIGIYSRQLEPGTHSLRTMMRAEVSRFGPCRVWLAGVDEVCLIVSLNSVSDD